jgi:hypothetical protein
MSRELIRLKSRETRRWLGLLLTLTIFFLPLHFHVISAVAAQITKECTCLQGRRTEANPVPVLVVPAPLVAVWALAPEIESELDFPSIPIRPSRAPPSLASR